MSNEKSTAEVEQPSTALSRVERIQIDPQALIQTALAEKSPIETIERLVALATQVSQERARQAWYAAMADFQRLCPPILKTKRADAGRYTFTYAPLSEIMEKVSEVMGPLGLSVSYRVKHENDQIISVCRISHEMGHHEESGPVPIPIDKVTPGPNSAQRIGIARSYSNRYAFLNITGIAPQDDDDIEAEATESGKDKAGVAMPRRASEATSAPDALNAWTGKIIKIDSRTGKTNNVPWTLYQLITNDGQEFSTFEKAHADFAREAGTGSKVRIIWEKTAKGVKVLSIEPFEEGPDA